MKNNEPKLPVKDRLLGDKVPNPMMMEPQATWAYERAKARFTSHRLLLNNLDYKVFHNIVFFI